METTSPPRKRGRTEEQLRLTLEDAINVFQKIVNRPNHTPLSSKAIAELTACIQAGVDINVKRTQHPKEAVLKYFIHNGYRDAVLAVLESPNPIHFTITDDTLRHTPLHAIALANTGSSDYNREIARAVAERIARCPMDTVEWGQKDSHGRDFISLAAQNQLLSSVWPEVRDAAYFADNTKGVVIQGVAWEWDWEALPEADRKELSCERLLQASRTTGRLCSLGQQLLLSTPKQRLALQSSILEEARQCVDDGADVMIKATHFFDRPLLATSMAKLPIDFSEILLRAQHPIDFTAVDSTGFTVLHFIPMVKENEGVARLLHLVLNRVQQHPEDRIDWTLQTMFYNAPTDYAAIHSHLAVWVKILVHDRPVAYFTQAGRDAHRISIREKVSKKDWEQLPPEDQNRFCLEKGFKT